MAHLGKSRQRRRSWPLSVLGRIKEMAASELSSGAIHRRLELEARSGEAGFGLDDVPSRRTIHDIVVEHTPKDETERWLLKDAEGDEATLVLPVLATVIEKMEGRRSYVTQAEAKWVVHIRRATPDLDLWTVYTLALAYMVEVEGGTKDHLDAFLAFAPWRSDDDHRRYNKATEKDLKHVYD